MVLKCTNLKQRILKSMQLHYVKTMFKNFSVGNIKKTELYGYVYDFSFDYDTVGVDDMLDINKHFMKKHDIK